METRLSSKGQIVLPSPIRRKLGLSAGDRLKATVEGDRVILAPLHPPRGKVRTIVDPISGLPVLSSGPDSPEITSRQVAELLAEFP